MAGQGAAARRLVRCRARKSGKARRSPRTRIHPRFASGSCSRLRTIADTTSSGTSFPESVNSLHCLPSAVPAFISPRMMSPVEIAGMLSSGAILFAKVPFPTPGAPRNTRLCTAVPEENARRIRGCGVLASGDALAQRQPSPHRRAAQARKRANAQQRATASLCALSESTRMQRIFVTRRLPSAVLERIAARPNTQLVLHDDDEPCPRDKLLALASGASAIVCMLSVRLLAPARRCALPALSLLFIQRLPLPCLAAGSHRRGGVPRRGARAA